MNNGDTLKSEIEEVLQSLSAMPDRLAARSLGLDDARLNRSSAEGEWSANQILAHLRACADVWGKSILAMIAQEHPTLRYVSPRTRMKKSGYAEQGFHPSLRAFTEQRNELVRTLNALDMAGWCRRATFTGTTRGREQTVLSYAQRIAQHEDEHCTQLGTLLG